jgi:hypothetical protein
MEKGDCDRIKLALTNGPVNASIVERLCEPVAPPNTVWGQNSGEGDFKDGLNGWEIVNGDSGKGWVWTKDGDCLGSYLPTPCNMETPTICNGAVSINGNALDVSGECPAPCVARLFSPNIDLSGVTISSLNLQFSQTIREFNSTYLIMTSYDNGATYPDTFAVNNDVFSNDAINFNQLVRVGLCGIDPSIKQIKIQFYISANYYFWGIDDVFLINESYSDPQTNNNFWAVSPNLKTPTSQASEFPLLSDIRNNGAVASTNTVLRAILSKVNGNTTVTNGTLTKLSEEQLSYGNVEPCQQIENEVFDNLAEHPKEAGLYQLDYTIKSDNNKFASNDTRSSRFMMTENVFSNGLTESQFGRAYLGRFISGVNPAFVGSDVLNWSLGHNYYFPNGAGHRASEFKFGVDTLASNGAYSALISASVYKVLSNSEDRGNITGAERQLVGKGINPDDGSEEIFVDNTTVNRRRLKFNLVNLDGGDLVLENNTSYLFVLNCSGFTGTAYFPFLSFNPNSSNTTLRWSYTDATNLAWDSIPGGNTRYWGTVVSRGAAAGDDVTQRSLATNFFKRLYNEVTVEKVSGTNDPLNETALQVYPNPASTELNLVVNLDKTTDELLVELFDVTGKVVSSEIRRNFKSDNIKLNTAKLNTGIYVAKITSADGYSTKKVVINND